MDTVLRLLAKLLDMKTTSSETKSWVLMAMTKLCEGGAGVSVAREVSETYSSSLDTVLRQRAQELQHLSQDPELRARVLPRHTGLEPLEVTWGCRTTIMMLHCRLFINVMLFSISIPRTRLHNNTVTAPVETCGKKNIVNVLCLVTTEYDVSL